MESSRKKWASITLLSIVLPISLLVSFRLTGILQEPLVPETVEIEVVKWNMSRPVEKYIAKEVLISESVMNVYTTDIVFLEFDTAIYWYHENDPALPFGRNDGLSIRLTASANISSGFVHSITIKFSDNDGNASLDILEDPSAIRLHNVVQRVVDWRPTSYIEVSGVNQPAYCKLQINSFWVFFDENDVDHEMTATLEATYFNGSVYRRAVLPIQMEVFVP